MSNRSWRDAAEAIGVISIVLGLLLVAWEIRQANDIARAEVIMRLAEQYNEFNSARFENPEVARLGGLMFAPEGADVSALDESAIAGAAWHFGNILWSAQVAYENGILELEDLAKYRRDLQWMLDNMPALRDQLLIMHKSNPDMRGIYVFEPLDKMLESAGGTD